MIGAMYYVLKWIDAEPEETWVDETWDVPAKDRQDAVIDKNQKYIAEAKRLGYYPGTTILHQGRKLTIDYGMRYDMTQQAVVVGCHDDNGNFYPGIPIYYTMLDRWAQLA
jgi:hypothetical protein